MSGGEEPYIRSLSRMIVNPIVTGSTDRSTVVGVEDAAASRSRDDLVYVARPQIATMLVVDDKDQVTRLASRSLGEQACDEFAASTVHLLTFL